jgi:hypothetical protein
VQYALGALAVLLALYALNAVFGGDSKRVMLVDFECFTPPQRCALRMHASCSAPAAAAAVCFCSHV